MKNLLLIVCIAFSFSAFAQRDINHWQLSVLGGGFYFNKTLANSLEDIEEPGFYTLGLRVQKKLGTDFQIGLTFLENRLSDDFDISVRTTDVSLAYHWDNGYLLSQRVGVAPYHLVSAGFRSRGSGSEVNFDSTKGLLSLENGVKVRLGDNWSTHVAFLVNWNSDDEQFTKIFDRGYNYGAQVGVSYHFGAVRTNYKGAVFNAGRDFVSTNDDPYASFYTNDAYLALSSNTAYLLAEKPEITLDSLIAQKGLEVVSGKGNTATISRNDKVYHLIGNAEILDSVYTSNSDVVKIPQSSLRSLKTPPVKSVEESKPKAKESDKEESLIDKQNRLIENQNEFIRLMLSSGGLEKRDSSMQDSQFGSDFMRVNERLSESDSTRYNLPDEEDYTSQDSLALVRITEVDSAHVTQWKGAADEIPTDTLKSRSTTDTSAMSRMQRQLEQMEAENDKLRKQAESAKDSVETDMSKQIYSFQDTGTTERMVVDTTQVNELQDELNKLEEENEKLRQQSDKEKVERVDVDEQSVKSQMVSDTTSARGTKDSDELKELEERLRKLEEENERLKNSTDSKEDRSSSEKSASSTSDQAMLDETKRRNDLLERQIDATEKLAEKDAQPTTVVIEDERRRNRGVNIQPGVVLPIGGGNKKENKELEENQRQMQARLDSLSREVSELKAGEQPVDPPTTTTTGDTWRGSGAIVAAGGEANSDSASSDSTDVDALAMDTVASADTIQLGDTLPRIDTLGVKGEFEMTKDTIPNPKLTSAETEETKEITAPVIDTTSTDQPIQSREETLEPGTVYPVSVYFALNSSNLSADDQAELKTVADDLKKSTDGRISLEGHTDKSGNAAYNEALSKKRADAVKNYLVENGVDASRITISPMGSKGADKAYNVNSRRVDVILK